MANVATSPGDGGLAAPIDLQLRFECLNPQHFVQRHGGDLSRGGIFVRSRERLAVGRTVKLDLQLGDGSPLIVGEGTVFWTRDPDAARGEQEFGMGVRFGRLTPPSQKMLAFLLAEKAERERSNNRGADGDDSDERTVVVTQQQLLDAHNAAPADAQRAAAAPPPTEIEVIVDAPATPAAAAPIAHAAEPEPEPALMRAADEPSAEEPAADEAAPAWDEGAEELAEAPAPRWQSRLRVVGGIAFLAAVAALIPMLFPKPAAKTAAARPAVVTPLVAQAVSPASPPAATAAPTALAH